MKGWGVDFGVCDVLVCVHDGVLVSDDGRRKGCLRACLAQSVERKTLNLVVVGSSPTVGTYFCASTKQNNKQKHMHFLAQSTRIRTLPTKQSYLIDTLFANISLNSLVKSSNVIKRQFSW